MLGEAIREPDKTGQAESGAGKAPMKEHILCNTEDHPAVVAGACVHVTLEACPNLNYSLINCSGKALEPRGNLSLEGMSQTGTI